MNNGYEKIKERIWECAVSDDNIKAVVFIGSTTRDDMVADEFSDLDVIIATEDAVSMLQGDYLSKLGNMKISFVEPTLGGGEEKRCIYEDSLDVDFVVFTPKQFENAICDGSVQWVCNRGYTVFYDAMDYTELLAEHVTKKVDSKIMTKDEYNNITNDFYFHTIWAMKKILRGEIWSAKMCTDAYLKHKLLAMLEMYFSNVKQVDVWHDGRFIDRWADDETKEALSRSFAHYDGDELKAALWETFMLFTKISKKVAEYSAFDFPYEAMKCAEEFLNEKSDIGH